MQRKNSNFGSWTLLSEGFKWTPPRLLLAVGKILAEDQIVSEHYYRGFSSIRSIGEEQNQCIKKAKRKQQQCGVMNARTLLPLSRGGFSWGRNDAERNGHGFMNKEISWNSIQMWSAVESFLDVESESKGMLLTKPCFRTARQWEATRLTLEMKKVDRTLAVI